MAEKTSAEHETQRRRRSDAAKKAWTPERRAARSEQTKGAGNPFWKGGRTIEPRGYVLVKVGLDHHLADCRGYAYEHRLIAEKKLGRRLTPDEIVHHDDERKSNNAPANLEPLTHPEHRRLHRKRDKGLRNPGEPNPEIECECGCGAQFSKFDTEGRPRRFVSGHNSIPKGSNGRFY